MAKIPNHGGEMMKRLPLLALLVVFGCATVTLNATRPATSTGVSFALADLCPSSVGTSATSAPLMVALSEVTCANAGGTRTRIEGACAAVGGCCVDCRGRSWGAACATTATDAKRSTAVEGRARFNMDILIGSRVFARRGRGLR